MGSTAMGLNGITQRVNAKRENRGPSTGAKCIVSSKEVSASGGHSNTNLQKEGSCLINSQPERKRIKKNSLAYTHTQTIHSPP